MGKYQDTVDFLFQQLPIYQNEGKKAMKKGLDGIINLLASLGNPHQDLKIIHIGGTNGKGSTCHILSSLIQGHGYSVGLYSSPHYIDYRERIKINNTLIPEDTIIDYTEKYKELILNSSYSFFEVSVAFAFLYFNEQNVDYVIAEVGMGGRLDSTNVVEPMLTAITNIGLDHQQFLGDTIAEIATEKAGIMKKFVPIIIGEKNSNTASVFKNAAKSSKAPLVYSSQMIEIEGMEDGRLKFSIQGIPFSTSFDLEGNFQLENLRLALAIYKIFCLEIDQDMASEDELSKYLGAIRKRTALIGRYQKLSTKPKIIIDSAHNEMGIIALIEELDSIDYIKLRIVTAMVSDKDHSKLFSLFPDSCKLYISKAQIPRAAEPKVLSKVADALNLENDIFDNLNLALDAALSESTKNDLILITGSVFTVAELLKEFDLENTTKVKMVV